MPLRQDDDTGDRAMDRAHVYRDAAGEWRWKIQAPNDEIIAASSEGYASPFNARRNLIRCGHGDLVGEPDAALDAMDRFGDE